MFGGSAPNVTKFWPPHVPELTEKIDEKALNMVPREEYPKLIAENPGLQVMPQKYLDKHKIVLKTMPKPQTDNSSPKVTSPAKNASAAAFSPQSTATKLTGPISSDYGKFDPMYSKSYLDSNQDELEEKNQLNDIKSIQVSLGSRRKFRYSTLTT